MIDRVHEMTDDSRGQWRAPDEALVVSALSRIGDFQHRRVFYERLENPLWVDALDRHKAFDGGPTLVQAEAGQYWQPWPEGDYLARMASAAPDAVLRVLLRLSSSDSPAAPAVVLRAALTMPPDLGVQLSPAIESYVQAATGLYLPELLDLVERYADAGFKKAALRLLQAAFRVRHVSESRGVRRGRKVTAAFEPYWYGHLLPKASELLSSIQGDKALATLTIWLEQFQVSSGDHDPSKDHDLSWIWRPSVAVDAQNNHFTEYGDDLVDAVRDLAVAQLANGRPVQEILDTLERSGQHLLRRIALHVLATGVNVGGDVEAAAISRLMDVELLDSDVRHEYAELARAVVPRMNEEDAHAWEELVLAGPPLSKDELSHVAARVRDGEEDLSQAADRYVQYWVLRLLSGIGRASLTEGAVQRLDELEAEHGTIEHAEFPSYSTSWVGPVSPLSDEEFSALSVDELLALLRSWTPDTSQDHRAASKEGLARMFQVRVREHATELSVVNGEQLRALDPTYIRALFSGLREALDAGQGIDWAWTLDVGAFVASQPDDGSEVSGSLDEDVVWRYAQRAFASLVERGTGESSGLSIPSQLLPEALAAVAPLVDHADPTVGHEETYGGSNMDPLTLSLNTTRPAALRAVLRLGSLAKTSLDEGAEPALMQQVVTRVLELADAHVGPQRDPSLAEAAAFGEGLGRLAWMDPEWVRSRDSELLPAEAYGDVVLSVAFASYRPSKLLMDVLEPAVTRLVMRAAAGEEMVSGWRSSDRGAVELAGDHLVLLMIWGHRDTDDALVRTYFENAPSTSIAKVLGHLGWLIGRSNEPLAEELLDRAMALWDWRRNLVLEGAADAAELSEFGWWVTTESFPDEWWLERLGEAIDAPGFDGRGALGEQLERVAPDHADIAVRLLARLLEGRDDAFGRYELVEHAPGVIAWALESGNEEAVATARSLMDALGRSGHLRISELVEQRRRSNG